MTDFQIVDQRTAGPEARHPAEERLVATCRRKQSGSGVELGRGDSGGCPEGDHHQHGEITPGWISRDPKGPCPIPEWWNCRAIRNI